ncbi:MAG TPA: ABC transporter permease [Acetivibrio clariflavus]|nr:ABC transporter permease [Acetivibrio clariflavus]
MLKRIILIELTEHSRKKLYYFYLVTVLLVFFISFAVLKINNKPFDFINISTSIFQNLTQIALIYSLSLLSSSVCKEYERRTMNWYKVRKIKPTQLILGKFIYYLLASTIPVLLCYFICGIVLLNIFETVISIKEIILVCLVILCVFSFVTALQIFISSFFKTSGASMIAIFISWLILSIVNTVVPFIKGFVAPFDMNSIQNNFVSNILLDGITFSNNHIMQILAIYLLPLIYTTLLLYSANFFVKKALCK